MSDEILSKIHFYLKKFNKRIPKDISVISISDGIFPHLTFPKTSFIKDSGSKMGMKACELLLDQIKNENLHNSSSTIHLELKTNLNELDSVTSV